MAKLRLIGNELTIDEGKDSFAGKLLAGCKGRIIVKSSRFGTREVKLVDRIKESAPVKPKVAEVKAEMPEAKPKATKKTK